MANMYSYRYTSWFVPGVKEWAEGQLKAMKAPSKYFDTELTYEEICKRLDNDRSYNIMKNQGNKFVHLAPTAYTQR